MALITCPECSRQVSSPSQFVSPLRFSVSAGTSAGPGPPFSAMERGWLNREPWSTLSFWAVFSRNGTFQGQTRPDPNRVVGIQMVAQANFQGTWQVSGAQLFIEFPLTMASGPAQTHIVMEFTRCVRANSLSGVDRFLRPLGMATGGVASVAPAGYPMLRRPTRWPILCTHFLQRVGIRCFLPQ